MPQPQVSVRIPAKIKPGEVFDVTLPSGKTVRVTCPYDKRGGDIIQIHVGSNGATEQQQRLTQQPRTLPPRRKFVDPDYAREVYRLARETTHILTKAKRMSDSDGCIASIASLANTVITLVLCIPLTLILCAMGLPLCCYPKSKLADSRFAKNNMKKMSSMTGSFTNWTFYLTHPHFHWIFRGIRKLGSQADELTKRTSRSDHAYVITLKTFKELQGFVKFEEALERNLIKKIDIDTDLEFFGYDSFNCLFVSHKWAEMRPDSPDNAIFRQVSKKLKEEGDPTLEYIWFDYMCVPQEDPVAQQQMLLSIPLIVRTSQVAPFFIDESYKVPYRASVWCQLEYMAVLVDGEQTLYTPGRGWTIYDISDLYFVLPGFIAMISSDAYMKRFVDGTTNQNSMVFLDILKMFIHAHELHEADREANPSPGQKRQDMNGRQLAAYISE